MITTYLVAAMVLMIYAFLPKIALSWSQALYPWHQKHWGAVDFARKGFLAVHSGLKLLVWIPEQSVKWAKMLVLRLRFDDKAPGFAPMATTAAVITFIVASFAGFSARGFLVGLGLGGITALIVRSMNVDVTVDDSEADEGLVIDLRPALAILLLSVGIFLLTR